MTDLHFNVQDAYSSLLSYVLDCLNARPIVVVSELSVLDETLFVDQLQKALLRSEVVLATVLLAWAGRSGGVCKVGFSTRLRGL